MIVILLTTKLGGLTGCEEPVEMFEEGRMTAY